MDAMYLIDISSRIDSSGVATFEIKGERVCVDGQPMVRMSHGTIMPAANWFASMREARLDAAVKLSEMARTLASQAEQMRASAEAAT